jgi:hypothetical protein
LNSPTLKAATHYGRIAGSVRVAIVLELVLLVLIRVLDQFGFGHASVAAYCVAYPQVPGIFVANKALAVLGDGGSIFTDAVFYLVIFAVQVAMFASVMIVIKVVFELCKKP